MILESNVGNIYRGRKGINTKRLRQADSEMFYGEYRKTNYRKELVPATTGMGNKSNGKKTTMTPKQSERKQQLIWNSAWIGMIQQVSSIWQKDSQKVRKNHSQQRGLQLKIKELVEQCEETQKEIVKHYRQLFKDNRFSKIKSTQKKIQQ
ncbi:hypothetical protein OXYTRIMIC_396 [Oxytricha trifallax]|uniref:Uncharacterized protein n=1 Tax=Oxytricha trifallax TaxID=1172189 RepID=A0A073HZC1_9SPIT|nr:hypothetical protein OXYTRIMIC_396 [Oxytricha trifallax]